MSRIHFKYTALKFVYLETVDKHQPDRPLDMKTVPPLIDLDK